MPLCSVDLRSLQGSASKCEDNELSIPVLREGRLHKVTSGLVNDARRTVLGSRKNTSAQIADLRCGRGWSEFDRDCVKTPMRWQSAGQASASPHIDDRSALSLELSCSINRTIF